jgi:Tfp pilus assembly protein FimT
MKTAQQHNSGKKRHPSGITAIELIVVVCILAILAKMFVPRFTREELIKWRVGTTAHNIASDVRYARRLALNGGTAGGSGKSYWFRLYKAASAATDTFKVYENGSEATPIKSTTTPWSDVMIVGISTDSFYFSTSGVPVPINGGGVTISDANNNYQWNVSVVKNTGRVSLTQIK